MNRDLRHALGRSAAKREAVKSQSLQIGGVDGMTEISQSVSATLSMSFTCTNKLVKSQHTCPDCFRNIICSVNRGCWCSEIRQTGINITLTPVGYLLWRLRQLTGNSCRHVYGAFTGETAKSCTHKSRPKPPLKKFLMKWQTGAWSYVSSLCNCSKTLWFWGRKA